MGNSELYVAVNSTSIKLDTQTEAINQAAKNVMEINNRYATIDHISYWTRNLAIMFTLVFTIAMIGTFFGILLIAISDASIDSYIIFIALEAIGSIMFIYFSIKMTGLNRTNMENSQRTFKFGLILLILLIGIVITTLQYKPIDVLIFCAKSESENSTDKIICIMLLYSVLSNIIKVVVTIGYLCIWVLMQILLRRITQMQILMKVQM